MIDFITFKSFISIEVLIVFYYIGVFILPIASWLILIFLIRKYKLFNIVYEKNKDALWKVLDTNQKIKFILFFLISFLLMQLFWRIFFEFLIAYMQIRDALLVT
ncbi:DUF4282 domain-containing protein [Sulfurimonas sp. CS5]|uniref:DUF4282 domain-containing protein n=1 Tax=Sulfurimonas sp. CS5 TaxID=3391145 RepID=UPI0039E875BC